MNNRKKISSVIKIFILLLFISIMGLVTIKFAPYITHLASNPSEFKELLKAYGNNSILIFICTQMAQVIIAAIPGEVVQITGGYLYGTVLGTLYSLTGIALGSVVVVFISRILGQSLLRKLITQKKYEKFSFLMNSKKAEIAIFILFLIPGMPKDILTYIAGFTPVRPVVFLIISTVARFPALLASSYIGSNMQQGNFVTAAILSIAAGLIFVAGLLMKNKVIVLIQNVSCKKRLI